MTLVPVALAIRSNPARTKQAGTTSLVNCYVEQIGEDGKVPFAIHASDGLQGLTVLPEASGGVRAMLEVAGYLWSVAGTGFYRTTPGTESILIGSMNISTTAPVYILRNRRTTPDILIICDGLAYYYRTTFQQVTDADLLGPISGDVVNGRFVIGTSDNQWQAGDIDDASAWDPLSFERADANADDVVRVAARQGEALIFGALTTEFWSDQGLADGTGFSRVQVMDLGCAAQASVGAIDQTLGWVAHDRTVRRLVGYQGERISTHAVERAIESLSDRTTIRAANWVRDGHYFYQLSSPDWTWGYDSVTGFWHERKTYGRDYWRGSVVTTFGSRIVVGDRDEGIIYEMGPQFSDEAGDPLVMQVTLPPVHAYPKRITVNAVYLDVEKGVGLADGAAQDVNPVVLFEWSRDGGHTFHGERELRMGRQGQRVERLATHRLGQSNENGFVFRLTCSARVARAIYDMKADVEVADL